jgi:hypothetical protein
MDPILKQERGYYWLNEITDGKPHIISYILYKWVDFSVSMVCFDRQL